MTDMERIRRCTTAGIDVQTHLQSLVDAIDDERGEAARHHLADVLVDIGAMQSCGIEVDRGEAVRHAWELMPLISPGVDNRVDALEKAAELALSLEITPSNLVRLAEEQLNLNGAM